MHRIVCSWLVFAVVVGAGASADAASFSIAAGYDRTCAVDGGGNAFCWGDDESGAVGDERKILSRSPLAVRSLSGVASIASGSAAGDTCAVTTPGLAYCWGINTDGQLGNGTTAPATVPAPVSGMASPVRSIVTADTSTCALTVNGGVFCWGSNVGGERGDGTIGGADSNTPSPVVGLGSGVRLITAGAGHTCALTTAGNVLCWGYNNNGELGNGTFTNSGTPVAVSGLPPGIVAVTAGAYHTCALDGSGNAFCWGFGGSGRLGGGSTATSAVPQPVPGLTGISQIFGGGSHTCAIKGASVYCWGWNGDGQLGNGSTAASSVPVAVVQLALGVSVKSMALGEAHTCALFTSGSMQCWGYGGMGQLGTGTLDDHSVPATVAGLPAGVVAITAGSVHTCALTASGAPYCWGGDSQYELGDGQAVGIARPSTVFGTPAGVSQVSTGYLHGCAVTNSGSVYCWGNDAAGQLGTGGFGADQSFASQVNVSGATAVAAGAFHTCVVAAGGAQCWGYNNHGQLGDGSATERATPAPVANASGLAAIGAGYYHTCARTNAGGVVCWGDNASGQLGNGGTADARVPVAVAGLSNVASIAVGGFHGCALSNAGGVSCWGDNANGQLGDGTTANRSQPVAVAGLPRAVSISSGQYHTCALTSAGTVMCWGYNAYGQLGNGLTADSGMPVQVQGLPSGVIAIAAGTYHTCALIGDGTVRCWGYNSTGGLGDGTFANRAAPAVVVNWFPGSIRTGDWFLNLSVFIPKAAVIATSETPTFIADTTGNAATAVVGVKSSIQFRDADVGKAIYVFGYVPTSLARGSTASKDAGCVLAQLNASGQLQPSSASSLQPYTTNVTTSQGQAIEILNGVPATNVAGGTFCVGTGSDAAQATSKANTVCVATVPPTQQGGQVCLGPNGSAIVANAPGGLSGLWWNPGESGWGIAFTQRRNIVFAAWYTYDASGNPKWYVASNCNLPSGVTGTSGACSGSLYQVNGPTFFGTPFNPSLANVTAAGNLQVSFTDANNATMSYTVAGQSRTVPIVRQVFGSGTSAPTVDYTDLWWNPSESGWGLEVIQQSSNIFLAWYVYDGSGSPTWYVASNCAVAGSGCSGTLYSTKGPAFGPTFNPSQVQVLTAGTVTLSFSDPNNGTLSYTANGVSGTKTITRQLF